VAIGHRLVTGADQRVLPFMKAHANELKADLALVCDTGMWDTDTPVISTRLRGMFAEQITIEGPSLDLHSGMYGGPAINPIRVLTRVLADLHDNNGRVTLDGFYDGVNDISEEVLEQWRGLGLDEWPNPAVFAGCGGSIPVVGHIKNLLDMDSLLIGFGLDDDAIHSPNEKYAMRSFHKGIRSWVRVLAALRSCHPAPSLDAQQLLSHSQCQAGIHAMYCRNDSHNCHEHDGELKLERITRIEKSREHRRQKQN